MGNNPMVGATVAVAVSVEEAAKAGNFKKSVKSGFMGFLRIDKMFEKKVYYYTITTPYSYNRTSHFIFSISVFSQSIFRWV